MQGLQNSEGQYPKVVIQNKYAVLSELTGMLLLHCVLYPHIFKAETPLPVAYLALLNKELLRWGNGRPSFQFHCSVV